MKFHVSNSITWDYHRYGWKYVLNLFSPYLSDEGVILDGFVDATFGFIKHEAISRQIIPYKGKWIGFWHHPINIPPWVDNSKVAPEYILKDPDFTQSIKNCVLIFTFSEYLADYLRKRICDAPIVKLYHPTGLDMKTFSFNKFTKNKKIIQIGSWLRRMTSFYKFQAKGYKKYLLMGNLGKLQFQDELNFTGFNIKIYKDVKYLPYISNALYDELLSESIVFLDLFDSSVNNTVIECIVRNTPIIINKIPAVVEYLGNEYPLYYTDLTQIPKLLQDYTGIKNASLYLKHLPIRRKLSGEYFIDSFFNECSKYISQ